MKNKRKAQPKEYDVILIGAGIGGLICSNYLAMKGYRVLLLEKHIIPGGYLTGFYRKGFYFDAGDQSFGGGHMIVFPSLEELGLSDKIEFVPAPWRFVCPDFDVPIRDLSEVSEVISSAFPEDRHGILALFNDIEDGVEKLNARDISFEELENISKEQWLNKYLNNEKLINVLMKNGYPWSAKIEISFWYQMLYDYWHIKGGTQKLSDMLARNIIDYGGEIGYKCQVVEILIEKGCACGVVTERGETIRSNYVVTCCDLKHTFGKLINKIHLDPSWLVHLKSLKESETFVAVYLGTDIPPDEMKNLIKGYHLTVYDNYDIAHDTDTNDPDLHKKTFLEITSPSMGNPSLAPEGKSSLIIQAISSYEWMDTWKTGPSRVRTKEYVVLKKIVASQLIEIAERVIPDLSKRIESIDVGTPLTHEDYTFNSRGATAGWSWKMNDSPYHDSRAHYSTGLIDLKINTPIANLYAASHWASKKGGGAAMAWEAGKLAAKEIIDQLATQ